MVQKMSVTIYHNPACQTSRNVLQMIRASGVEPKIVEYLKAPPDRAALASLLRKMALKPREILRRRGTPYDELDLGNPSLGDDKIIDAILAHPILIERPIVVTPKGARICRPPETVKELL
jgi:arsenate reductase